MKTAISIPDKVFRSADALAKRLGISRSQLYSEAVEEFLARHRGRRVTERLNSVYEHEDSSLPPGLMRVQSGAIESGKW